MLVKFVLVSMLICFAPPLGLRDCKHWSALCQTQGDFWDQVQVHYLYAAAMLCTVQVNVALELQLCLSI